MDFTSPNKYILPATTRQLSLSPFNCFVKNSLRPVITSNFMLRLSATFLS
jgi:hypothetical protein